jgi:hypothetical protein
MPTAAVPSAKGYSSSVQAPQQLIPQLQLASNPSSTAAGAGFNINGQQYMQATGMPIMQQQQQLAGMPLIMAPPAAAGAAGMPAGVPPVAFPTVPKESLSILVTDPRNSTGPHPWDVLLFKTNQFNTSKPAYRLGGLGLMLMTDFNKSHPLTDWNILHKEEPKQRPQVFEKWNFGSAGSSSGGSSSGGSSTASSSGGASPPPAAGGGAPLFGFGGLMSKNPLLNFGSTGKETTPRFSSLFKLPQLPHLSQLSQSAAGASLDAVGIASVPAAAAGAAAAAAGAAAAAAEPQVDASGSVRLWCTACQAPAYFLSAYGHCGEWYSHVAAHEHQAAAQLWPCMLLIMLKCLFQS